MSNYSKYYAEEIHKLGGVLGLVALLNTESTRLQSSALLALGNLATNSECRFQSTVHSFYSLLERSFV